MDELNGTFSLTVELGNDAMNSHLDLAKALETVAARLRREWTEGKIMDANGNSVGRWDLHLEMEE